MGIGRYKNMKIIHTHETVHSSLNCKMEEVLQYMDKVGVYFSFKLADRLKERNLTMRDFAKMSGLRLATISDICNGKKQSLNLHHVLICMLVLRITKLSDIIEIVFPEELKAKYESESKSWIEEEVLPEAVQLLMAYLQGEFDGKPYKELEQDERILRHNNLLKMEYMQKRKE